jgi:hypothetical protein
MAMQSDDKIHPWRKCPRGKHFVKEHTVHVPPSKKHPNGTVATVHEHCASNPSHKDELTFGEIEFITNTYFKDLTGAPAANVLVEFSGADKYDAEIRGWVKYWNDIFQLNAPLNPNLIKALIATESSFDPNPSGKGSARGLMQIMSLTSRILSDTKGELKDFLVRVSRNEVLDPSANICSGIRWLFRKKDTASARLGRVATWDEAVIEYKGYWDEVNSGNVPKAMRDLRDYIKRLEK